MKLNNMELMTVLSFALVYNGQELKKYQQMLIKENISLDSFMYQLIKVEQTEENTKQDNIKQNDQDNTKQNDSETTPKQDTENKKHLATIAALAVVGLASIVAVVYLIIRFINFVDHAFTTVVTDTITNIKILIFVAVIALAYIFRDVPLYWITVKALKEQKKQQQQDDRQNRDRRDRFNENREPRNYYKQKYQEHEQKYNQLVNQKIETLPRLVIVST